MSLLVVSDKGVSYSVRRGSVGSRLGWCFEASNGLLISALYKTKLEAEDALEKYIKTDKFDWYGSAE